MSCSRTGIYSEGPGQAGKQADGNLVELNTTKNQVLHLRWDNATQQDSMGTDRYCKFFGNNQNLTGLEQSEPTLRNAGL